MTKIIIIVIKLLLLLLLLLYGLNTRYVIDCDSEESQVWESRVTVGRHNHTEQI